MRWRTKAGDVLAANLGEALTKDLTAHAWRTALDPKGEWMGSVLQAADQGRHQGPDGVVHLAFVGAEPRGNVLYRNLRVKIIKTGHVVPTFIAG